MDPYVVELTLTPRLPGAELDADSGGGVESGRARSIGVCDVELVDRSDPEAPSAAGMAALDLSRELAAGKPARAFLDEVYRDRALAPASSLALGRFLYQALVVEPAEIGALWAQIEERRRAADRPLHLWVKLDGADGALDGYPLELLADDDGFVFWRPEHQLLRDFSEVPEARARRLLALGRLYADAERMDDAGESYWTALGIYDRLNERAMEAWTRKALGDLFLSADRLGEAGDAYLSALVVFEVLDELEGRAEAHAALGELYLRAKRWDEGRRSYEAALPLFEALDDALGQAEVLTGLGNLDMFADRPEDAYERFRRAMTLHRAAGDRMGTAATRGYMARAAQAVGQYARAGMLAAHAWAMFRDQSDQHGQRVALDDLTQILRERGDVAGALAAMFLAWVAARALTDPTADERAEVLSRAFDTFDPMAPSRRMYNRAEDTLFHAIAACQEVLDAHSEEPFGPLSARSDADAD